MGIPKTDEEKTIVDLLMLAAEMVIDEGKSLVEGTEFEYKGKMYDVKFTVKEME